MTQIKPSLAALTDIGDIAIDPSTFTINTLTPDGIKQITTSAGTISASTPPSRRVMEDNRPGVAQKPLAIRVSIDDFERLSRNDDAHLIRLIQNANNQLHRAIQDETRCADCRNLEIKVEQHDDQLRATTNHVLTAQCGLRKPGMTNVVCPDGRVSGVADQSLYQPESIVYAPEVTPKANPDQPTGFDEAW